MIEFDRVTVTYPGETAPVLADVTLRVAEGELCLVVGRTGSGKSTLLGLVNGLVPHFTGGTLAGAVTVAGRSTATNRPRELADAVGVVQQDPLAGFVTDTVEEELAYGMEQLALPPEVMRKRVEETLDLLGLAELRDRALRELSGGQQQRVAIGAVLTPHPRVLVLDEPTSALDPTAAEETLAAITRLVHDLGLTVLMAEHRLERVIQHADQVIHLPGDTTASAGPAAEMLETASVAAPIVELARAAQWSPVPLSIRDARRRAAAFRARLADHPPHPAHAAATSATEALRADGIVVRYGEVVAVAGVDVRLVAGEIVALMGRNGSGKSSLLWALQGSGRRQAGRVAADGRDPGRVSPAAARRLVGLVPQTAADLLYLPSVAAELAQADRETADVSTATARELLDRIAPGISDDTDPRDLSEGQRLSLVLAIQLRAAPGVILLDEPTRGLDYGAKRALAAVLDELAREGRSIVLSTHDVEFVAAASDRVVVMAQGEIVADGPTAEIVVASPAFAPQVAKILAPLPYLTVGQVLDGLLTEVET
ncbi:MAG TPA: ATP-binding cassette domain-containing protein [Solirubrobacteraceae bacterium]|nr:ATP-binding cassette domain-containing protein [Solirubrobacteraceae bacterium]